MLARLLTKWGFTRDDEIWWWGQICGVSAAVASGVFDLHYWSGYVGVPFSERAEHIVTAIAVFVLWLSGKMNYSKLPADPAKH
jgi:hypothetical protein